jgi:stage II sporulation protein D
MATVATTRSGRFGLALLCGAIAAGLPALADEVSPRAEPIVRVQLLETGSAVRVSHGGGTVQVKTARGGLAVGGKRVGEVWRPARPAAGGYGVDGRRYRGGLELRRTPGGISVVNRVGLEDYVAGTLGREVYSSWHPEMLKAQAVVTRTYALHEMTKNASGRFDVGAGTGSQVYGGRDAETAAVLKATRATRGQYLAYHRAPILAVFHSASGGRTAASDEVWGEALPYLVSVEVENEEDSPDTYWRATVSGTTLGRALAHLGIEVGTVRDIRVVERSASGRATRLRVRGKKRSQDIAARALRTALGASVIRSTLFEIKPSDDGFIIVGSGHGHGVGMSQWGAQAMAQGGARYRKILSTFYPGTSVMEGFAR